MQTSSTCGLPAFHYRMVSGRPANCSVFKLKGLFVHQMFLAVARISTKWNCHFEFNNECTKSCSAVQFWCWNARNVCARRRDTANDTERGEREERDYDAYRNSVKHINSFSWCCIWYREPGATTCPFFRWFKIQVAYFPWTMLSPDRQWVCPLLAPVSNPSIVTAKWHCNLIAYESREFKSFIIYFRRFQKPECSRLIHQRTLCRSAHGILPK